MFRLFDVLHDSVLEIIEAQGGFFSSICSSPCFSFLFLEKYD